MKKLWFILTALLLWCCQPESIIPPKPEEPKKEDTKPDKPDQPDQPDTQETPETPEQPEEPEVPGEVSKLTGTVIGTSMSVNYDTGQSSTTVNTRDNVFDGNYDTFFASYDRSRTWVGLDLGTKHVITKVGYSPRISQEGRVELALIEGANQPDFSDALPLAIIKQKGIARQMSYIDINFSRGVRYVRYVGPNNARCNLSELEFYGWEGHGDDSQLYQLTNLPTTLLSTKSCGRS